MRDNNFESEQLTTLVSLYLKDHPIKGQIIFSASNEHRLEWCRWKFEDTDYQFLKNCGFRSCAMELIDQLIEYRYHYSQPNSDHGLIDISGESISIRWVDLNTVEQACSPNYPL